MDISKWILIVEDEQYQSKTLSLILEKTGYQVSIAASSEEACIDLQNQYYDLVLLDLHLDRVYGLELLEQIQGCNPETKILIVTGNISQEVQQDALQRGADGIIYKPVSPPELLDKISLILS